MMYLNRLIRQLFFLITFGIMLSWLPTPGQASAYAIKDTTTLTD
ncbi:hypothetical protein [Spartinivicinus marinus]|nr:hypothetical protein [Spartinivicinus marinus]MCX4029187.1 hypothetical protein [Spartinivicinus marinus]